MLYSPVPGYDKSPVSEGQIISCWSLPSSFGISHKSPTTTKSQPNTKEAIRYMGRRFINYLLKSSSSAASACSNATRTENSRLATFALVGFCLAGTLALGGGTAQAQSAAGWNKRGEKAELRQDYDLAYESYKMASQKAPKDIRY
jgi:general secretion pathway protein D